MSIQMGFSQVIIAESALQELQSEVTKRRQDMDRLRIALETLAAINEPEKFKAVAMALVNQLAARWQAERVSLGFLKGREVRLVALSHTEKFTRQMRLVQDLEAAMEECLDQDLEVVYPAAVEAGYVSRATAVLATQHGPMAIVSLPIRRQGRVVGVVTLERQKEKVLGLAEIEILRLTCDLSSARLWELYRTDRWLGARLAEEAREGFSEILGPRHTWAKVTAIAISALLAFTLLVKGNFKAEAPFTLEASEKLIIPAPFDSFIKTVPVEVSAPVQAQSTTLATLETAEIEKKLAELQAEKVAYQKQADKARSEGKIADQQMAEAQAAKSLAQIQLLEYQISKSRIFSTVDGVVLTGDLKKKLGAPVKTGEVLFEVAPLAAIKADLSMPEDLIPYVQVGQKGYLATASYPGDRLEFLVERVNPVAEVASGHNIFKVRVSLQEKRTWLRPGMEGVAKVHIDQRCYAYIWTRSLINWVRMKLWI